MKTYNYLLRSKAYEAINEDDWYSVDEKKGLYRIYSGDSENPYVVKAEYHWLINDYKGDRPQ